MAQEDIIQTCAAYLDEAVPGGGGVCGRCGSFSFASDRDGQSLDGLHPAGVDCIDGGGGSRCHLRASALGFCFRRLLYPSGEGLVAAAAEHFAFQSATGGEDLSVIEDVSGSHAMESRLGRLENLVGNLAAKLEAALPVPQTVDAQPKGSRPSALRKSGKQKEDPPHVSFPSLDPSVVASAIAAGVDTQSLQQMQSMMDQPGIKGKKVAEP